MIQQTIKLLYSVIMVFVIFATISLASEVNRLKIIVDDLKTSHEEKDNAISRIQIEIERLREVSLAFIKSVGFNVFDQMMPGILQFCHTCVIKVMLCYIMLCYVMLHYMLYYVMLSCTALDYVTLPYVALCYITLCYTLLQIKKPDLQYAIL